jgi:hypothetical protein
MDQGSMAYNGHIPAEAIEHVSPYNHEPYSYDENGKPFVKITKETYPQQVRRWEGLGGLDNARLLHTFPDGHTIYHLPTYGDVGKVGTHLVNCWKDKRNFSDPKRVLNEGDPYAMQYLSLHDPNGVPKVGFYVHNDKVQEGFAARNKKPAPEHIQMLRDYAAQSGLGFEEPEYDHAIYQRGVPAQIGEPVPAGSLNAVR